MKEAYVRFMSNVTPASTGMLLAHVSELAASETNRLHLLISCIGGSLQHALSAYNFLRGTQIEVYTYNFGSVQSAGILPFCAGTRRFTTPTASFMAHCAVGKIEGNASAVRNVLRWLEGEDRAIARAISEATGKPEAEVMEGMRGELRLCPLEAKEYGLVHEIVTELLPKGVPVFPIDEPGPLPEGPQRIWPH